MILLHKLDNFWGRLLWAPPVYLTKGEPVALTDSEIENLEELAEAFVGAFVKCAMPPAKYTVCSIPCFSLEEAVGIAVERCSRHKVAPFDKAEQQRVLCENLRAAIKGLQCG